MMRVEHEYDRGGALAYLAAYDVHRAQLFGRTEPTTGIEPFGRLVEQVMTSRALRLGPAGVLGGRQRQQPPRPSIHRPPRGRLAQPAADPPASPRFLAEPDRDRLLHHPAQSRHPQRLHRPRPDHRPLAAFEDRYNASAEPFDWRFTRDDLAQPARTHRRPRPSRPAAAVRRLNRYSRGDPRRGITQIQAAGAIQGLLRDCRPSPRWAGTIPRNRRGWPDTRRTPSGSPNPRSEAGTAASPPRRSGHPHRRNPTGTAPSPLTSPATAPRARAESRWLNEDFVDSGIFTPPRLRPRTHTHRHQRTSADEPLSQAELAKGVNHPAYRRPAGGLGCSETAET